MESRTDDGRRSVTIHRLTTFPQFLRGVIESIDETLWRTRSSGGGFALVEHAWHLADLDEEGFGARIARLLAETEPYLPDFAGDVIALERRYIEQPVHPALERFRVARETNCLRLTTVAPSDWARRGAQEHVGEITLEGVLESMLAHDIEHAVQLNALLIELGASVSDQLRQCAERRAMS